MKSSLKSRMIIFYALLAIPSLLSAQTFTLEVTPNIQTGFIGQPSTFFVVVKPINSYNASVFLSVSSTPQFYGTVELSATTINSPYKTATLKIIPSIQDTGTKVIELKAVNNGVSATATCSLTIQKNVQWTTVTPTFETKWEYPYLSLNTDWEGNVCYATFHYVLPTNIITINHYKNQQFELEKFSINSIVAHPTNIPFDYDKNGTYWLSTYKGIFRYDGKFTTNFNEANAGFISDMSLDIKLDKNGYPACTFENTSTNETYISRYDGADWKSFKIKPLFDGKNNPIYIIPIISFDSLNQIMLTTYGGGIIRIHDTIQDYLRANGDLSIGSDTVLQVLSDKEGGLWCLHNGNSPDKLLSYFDGTAWKYIAAPTTTGISPQTFMLDADKHIWLSSATGLHFYDGTAWTTYDKSNSPLPKGTRSMVQDKNKNIWMVIDDLFYIFNPNGIVGIPLAPTTVEVESDSKDGIFLYPNPTSTNFTIIGANNIVQVQIMNNLGIEVFRNSSMVNGKVCVDVSDLTTGLYFVQMLTTSGMITKPIVVIH